MNDMAMQKYIEMIAQDASYKLGDLISGFPPSLLPVVVGALQAVLSALVATMPEEDKKVVEHVKDSSDIIILPTMFDPRRNRG